VWVHPPPAVADTASVGAVFCLFAWALPHLPLPPPSPPTHSRPGPGAASSSGRLTTHDALSYLREVKQRFANDKRVYDTFLNIMKEFKAQQ
jgi:hypothetical protein